MSWFWNNNSNENSLPDPYDIMTGQYYPTTENISIISKKFDILF